MTKSFETALEIALGMRLSKTEERIYQALDTTNKRLFRAIAENHSKTTLYGNVAIASTIQAGKLPIELVIVPLNVASMNKQGIRSSEKDNILATALHSSITASFDGEQLYGHKDSIAVGVLNNVYEENSVIKAQGYIWSNRNEELADYLRKQKQVGSSYEVYYATSTFDDTGVEWLQDITFTSQTLVARPAYGNLTPARLS